MCLSACQSIFRVIQLLSRMALSTSLSVISGQSSPQNLEHASSMASFVVFSATLDQIAATTLSSVFRLLLMLSEWSFIRSYAPGAQSISFGWPMSG